MLSAQTLLAQMTRTAAKDLAKLAESLGDKATFQPLGKGRSALDQVQECVTINFGAAEWIASQNTAPTIDMEAFGRTRAEADTLEKALPLLHESAEKLAQTIEAFPAEKLQDSVLLPFGPGMTKPFVDVMQLPLWNMNYHEGQINYIQSLLAE